MDNYDGKQSEKNHFEVDNQLMFKGILLKCKFLIALPTTKLKSPTITEMRLWSKISSTAEFRIWLCRLYFNYLNERAWIKLIKVHIIYLACFNKPDLLSKIPSREGLIPDKLALTMW